MEHNKAELREELPCFPESGMEPTVGSIMLMSSGTQSCEFTLLSYTDFEIFLAACWIQVLPAAASGLPSLAGSHVPLAAPCSQSGSLPLLSSPGFFPSPLFLREERI